MAEVDPRRASDYDDRTTVAVKSVLVEIGQVLGSYRGKFAVIGGAVPWLLLNQSVVVEGEVTGDGGHGRNRMLVVPDRVLHRPATVRRRCVYRLSRGMGSIDNLPESSRHPISGFDRITGNSVLYTPLKEPGLQCMPGDSGVEGGAVDIDYFRQHLVRVFRTMSPQPPDVHEAEPLVSVGHDQDHALIGERPRLHLARKPHPRTRVQVHAALCSLPSSSCRLSHRSDL